MPKTKKNLILAGIFISVMIIARLYSEYSTMNRVESLLLLILAVNSTTFFLLIFEK